MSKTNKEQWLVEGSTSFTIHAWLFKDQIEATGKIFTIDTSFIATSSVLVGYDELVTLKEDENVTEMETLSARPQPSIVDSWLIPTSAEKVINIQGDMFQFTNQVYISGNNFPGVATVNLFSGVRSLSDKYPAFEGVSANSFNIIDDRNLSVTLPSAVSAGQIDIIVVNEAGYGILTEDSFRIEINPFPEDMPEFSTWTPYQYPWNSGLTIYTAHY